MASAQNPSPPGAQTDMGLLKVFAPEIRLKIYKFALPARIVRFYRDPEKKHIFVETLRLPDLAFVCLETWYYCLQEYARVPFTPIYKCSTGQVQRITEAQGFDTWFCPWLDTLFFDTYATSCQPRLKKRPLVVADTATDSNSVTRFEYASAIPASNTWANTLAALQPFAEKATSIILSDVSDTFFYLSMNRDFFPSLEEVLFAVGTLQGHDTTAWAQQAAKFTQHNRAAIAPGQQSRRRTFKCRPLDPSRTRYDPWLKKDVPLGDLVLQQLWDDVPDTFPTVGFADDDRDHDYRALVERMAAVLRLYWDTGYVTDGDGNRVYKRY